MPNLRKSVTAILLTAILAACSSQAATRNAAGEAPVPEKLRVALLPDDNASTIIKNNEPLRLYLKRSSTPRSS